jgi:hypothetical protein
MRFHPASALLGLAVATLCLFTMSQGTMHALQAGVQITYQPHPRDYVQIKENTPFTVPPGKLFVLTALGATVGTGSVRLLINPGAGTYCGSNEFVEFGVPGGSIVPAPLGFTAPAGALLSVVRPSDCTGSTSWGRAWGYLAEQ